MDELDDEKRPSPIVFPDESEPIKDPEMIEMCDFFEFSVKENTNFRGTVEMITYLTEDKSDEPINYFIKVSDGEDNKAKTTWSYKSDKAADVKLSITKDKLLYIYSGKAGSGEITNMIWSGEVHVHDWNYRKLLQFANSFDYSSQKWDEFYKSREKANTIPETPIENTSNSNTTNTTTNPALELLSPPNTITTPTTITVNQFSSTPRSRRSFSPSKAQLKTLLKTPRVRQYVDMISNNKTFQFGKMPGLMINNKNLCCFGTWSLFYNSVPNLLNVEKLIKKIEPRLRYSYYDFDDEFPMRHLSYPIELIRTPVPKSRQEQNQPQLIGDSESNNENVNVNVNRQLFSSPTHPISNPPPPLSSYSSSTSLQTPQILNNYQNIQHIQQQPPPPPPPPPSQSLLNNKNSNNLPINDDNDVIGKMLSDIEFGGLTNFVTYVSKDEHESFLSKETKKKLIELRKATQSFLEKVPFDNIRSMDYYYQDYNPVIVDQSQSVNVIEKNQNQPKPVNVNRKSPLLSSMPSNFVEDKSKKKNNKKRKDSFGTLASFFSL